MVVNMCSSEDEEMMYYAGLLLELPQLVYLSEFKEAWKQGNWNSTKKRSAGKIRRAFDDFNCCTSLMARLGSSSSSECRVACGPSNKSTEKKKRKRTNPNPNGGPMPTATTTTTTLLKVKFKLSPSSSNGHTEKDSSASSGVSDEELLNVGGGDGDGDGVAVGVGKKRKNNPCPHTLTTTTTTTTTTELLPPVKKQKSSLKVTFKLSGRGGNGHTTIAGEKDSSASASSGAGVSGKELVGVASNVSDNAEQPEPSSSSPLVVVVDSNNANNPQPSSSADIDDDDDDKHMNKPLIPDLNIPITMTEDALPDPTTSLLLLPAAAAAVPMQTQAPPQPPMLLQNNNRSYNFVLVPAALPSLHAINIIHRYNASNDRAAAAKEKRTMRMLKLRQRKLACCQ